MLRPHTFIVRCEKLFGGGCKSRNAWSMVVSKVDDIVKRGDMPMRSTNPSMAPSFPRNLRSTRRGRRTGTSSPESSTEGDPPALKSSYLMLPKDLQKLGSSVTTVIIVDKFEFQ